jgi:hypothetical protein
MVLNLAGNRIVRDDDTVDAERGALHFGQH